MTDALQCPFCASSDIRFDCHPRMGRGPIHGGSDVWSTCCYNCGATFPNRYNREALESNWRRRPAPVASTFPYIGPDPMLVRTIQNRLDDSIAAVRAAYVRQQVGVPDQTALVWRWHIGALLDGARRWQAQQKLKEPNP
jgi:hypothetical protein